MPPYPRLVWIRAPVPFVAGGRPLLWLAVLVAALARLPTLGAKSLWFDELISATIAREPVDLILRARLHLGASTALEDRLYTNNPPLHLLLLHGAGLAGADEAILRLPFALTGIAAVPLTFALVRLLVGYREGLAAAFLIAVLPAHVAYSQEARPTVLLVTFSLAVFLFLLRALEGNRRRDWACFCGSAILGSWSSYFMLLLVLPTCSIIGALWVLRSCVANCGRGAVAAPARSAAWSGLLVAAGVAPLLGDLLYTAGRNEVSEVGISSPLTIVALLGYVLFSILDPIPKAWPNVLPHVVPVFALLGLASLVLRRRFSDLLLAVWILGPLGLVLAIQSTHMIHSRYLFSTIPAFLAAVPMGIAYLVSPLRQRVKPQSLARIQATLFALVVLVCLHGLSVDSRSDTWAAPTKPNWRDAAATYVAEANTSECLVVVDGLAEANLQAAPYYLGPSTDGHCWIDGRDPRLLDAVIGRSGLWWAIDVQFYAPEAIRYLNAELEDTGYEVAVFEELLLARPITALLNGAEGEELARVLSVVVAAEPMESFSTPGGQESLANFRALTGQPSEAAELVVGFAPPLGDQFAQEWGRARSALERGDVATARGAAVRLVAVYPGQAEVYRLVANIERFAQTGRGFRYEALAAELERRVTRETTDDE